MTLTTLPEKQKTPAPSPIQPALIPSWRLPGLDGLRAMACLMVYMVHCWEFAEQPKIPVSLFGRSMNLGHVFEPFRSGVDLFMVLSGFCLFWPCCKSAEALAKWDWKDYVKRRVRRIVPPYYAAIAYALLLPQVLVIFVTIIAIFTHHAWGNWTQIKELIDTAHWQDPSTEWRIISHLLFIHTLSPDAWDKVTGAFWSLGLEMQFYVVFPFVLFAFRKWSLKAIAGIIAISILFRMGSSWWFYKFPMKDPDGRDIIPFLFTITFLGRWMQFGIGMLAAWIVAGHLKKQKIVSASVGNLMVLTGLWLFILVDSGLFYDAKSEVEWLFIPWRDLLLATAFGLLVFAVTSSRTWIRPFFEWRPIVSIGFISYSIFLIHQPTAWYFSESLKKFFNIHGGPKHLAVTATVGLVITIGIAYLFFLAYERPYLSTSQKKAGASPKNAPPVEAKAAP